MIGKIYTYYNNTRVCFIKVDAYLHIKYEKQYREISIKRKSMIEQIFERRSKVKIARYVLGSLKDWFGIRA